MTDRVHHTARQAGMTLLEIMISIALLMMMMTVAWSTVVSTSNSKKMVEASQQRNHEIRVAMARMVRDISHAYLSANENQQIIDQTKRRTIFLGKSSGQVDELRFSSFAHEPMWADADECEQTMISYSAMSDRKNSRKVNLLRRETRRLSSELDFKQIPATSDILIRNIERVKFEYWDWKDKDWQDSWNSTSADAERGRLPTRVRITVEVKIDKDRTRKYTTQARIAMQEELRFVAPAQ